MALKAKSGVKAEELKTTLELPHISNNEEMNHIKIEISSSSNSTDESSPPKDLERGKRCEFKCKYCEKKFSSLQALGGHQNAHKRERALEKGQMEMGMSHLGFITNGFHPYQGMGPFPFRDPSNANPTLPMQFSPFYPRPNLELNHGFQGWYRPSTVTNQQARVSTQKMGDYDRYQCHQSRPMSFNGMTIKPGLFGGSPPIERSNFASNKILGRDSDSKGGGDDSKLDLSLRL